MTTPESPDYPYLVPMEFSEAMAKRLSWKSQYLSASGAICFPRLDGQKAIEEFAQAVPCAVRLTPFHDEFKSKMFASLGDQTVHISESFGVFFRYNAFTEKVDPHFEIRSQQVKLGDGRVFSDNEAPEKEVVATPAEKAELAAALEKFAKQNVAPQLHDSLACFFPDKLSLWRERLARVEVRNDVIPYPSLFPAAIPLTLDRDDATFYLVDHYSIDPKQPQVLFLIFKEDEESEQDVLWGGFRYDLPTQKIKLLPDMPGKYNAGQWLKEFDNGNPFAFHSLLAARRDFFITEVGSRIKPSRKGP